MMSRTVVAPHRANGHAPPRPEPVAPVVLAAPRQKRPSWVVGGAVAVALAALIGGWVFASLSERTALLVAARDLGPGEVLSATDVRVVEVGRVGDVRAVTVATQDLVVGKAARGPIPAGTILNTGLFVDRSAVIPEGMVVVGAALEPGATPTGDLAPGDRVQVLAVEKVTGGTRQAEAATLLTSGSVWSVDAPTSGASSRVVVGLLVPAPAQAAVAQAAADGRLRLALVGPGQ